MSTASFPSVASSASALPRVRPTLSGSAAFAALASVLAAVVFTTPITHAWKFSTYEMHVTSDESLETSIGEGTASRQIAIGTLGLVGVAALVCPGGRRIRVQSVLGALCVSYLMWCAASIAWSDDTPITIRRVIAISCEVAAALAIAKWTTPKQFVWIVFGSTLAWLILGFIAELSQRTLLSGGRDYRFGGLFHPNDSAAALSFLLFATLYLAREAKRLSWWHYMIIALSGGFLVLTGSRTGTFAAVGTIAGVWFATSGITQKLYAGAAGIAGLGVLLILLAVGTFQISEKAVVAMGRDDERMDSLTGRLPLWQTLMDTYIPQQPLLGHGYGAFWTAERSQRIAPNWIPIHAHSNYVDLILNVGFIGAFFFLAAMLVAFIRSTRLENRFPKIGFGFIAMIVSFAALRGFLETMVGITSFISFFGICGLCVLLAVDERELDEVTKASAAA